MKIWMLILIWCLLLGVAQARPQLPIQYYGVVSKNELPVFGKEVVVKDLNGVQVSVTKKISDTSGIYITNIILDDPETSEDEGASVGESVSLTIDEQTIKTVALPDAGEVIELALAIEGEEISSPVFDRPSGGGGSSSSGRNDPQDQASQTETNIEAPQEAETQVAEDVAEEPFVQDAPVIQNVQAPVEDVVSDEEDQVRPQRSTSGEQAVVEEDEEGSSLGVLISIIVGVFIIIIIVGLIGQKRVLR